MSTRALVFGGGGSVGNAWLIGVVAGLLDGGVDVREADLTIGTSAGSTAAAQIMNAPPAQLFADVLSAMPGPRAAPPGPVVDHMERTGRIMAAAADAADMRRRLGAAALEMDGTSYGARQIQWRATAAARLPGTHWPQRPLLIPAIDADTGEPVVFDRHSGVDLVDAVAASTSNGFGVPPYGIGGKRYLDGGYRADVNADLAAGYDRVLVLAPLGDRTRKPLGWGLHLTAQVDVLRENGSRVETIFADSHALEAFGAGLMDLSRRPPSAQAGYNQGQALAGSLSEFWR